MTRLIVEAGFGGTVADPANIPWTDISQYVDVVTGVSIGGGASDEVSEIQPATCSMTLDNDDGRFSSGRAAGAYYPNVKKNTPIRVSVAVVDPPIGSITQLVDNFDDNVVNTALWSGNFGGVSEVGGRARVPCTAGVFAGYKSAQSWTMPGSQVTVKMSTVPALSTGTDVWAAVWVNSATGGTRVGFLINLVTGLLRCESDVNFFDGATVSMAYSAVTHAWLRIRETAGILYWETSPDGVAWTVRRSLATPSWVASQSVSYSLESHRDAGVSDFAEFDQVGMTVGTNYVRNPSFETGLDTWQWSAASAVPTTAQAFSGTQSAQVNWHTASTTDYYETAIYGLTVGAKYIASAYVRVPAGDSPVGMRVAGTFFAASSTINDTWQRLTCTFTAPASVVPVRITPSNTPASGDLVYVDGVQVEDGFAVSTFNPSGATLHSRFYGMVNEWPIKWKGLQSTVSITCTDLFKWLNRQPALRPLLVEDTLAARPLAYYPLSEPDSSVSAGDLAGGGATSLSVVQLGTGGTLAFAGGTAPAETGLACPLFTPASASAGMYLRGDLGLAAETASGTYGNWLEVWIQTTVTGRTFLALSSTDLTFQVIFGLQAGTGLVEARYTQSGGPVSLFADWINLDSTNLADGKLHHLVIDEVGGVLYVDGVLRGNMNFGPQAGLRSIYVGGYTDGRLWSGSISHVAHYARSGMAAATLTPHYAAGAAGFAGESASTRIQRLARYAGVAGVTSIGTTFDSQASQGPGGSTALAMMQQVATTESARLFADRGSFALKVMSRDVRYNPVAAVSLSYADLETDSLEMVDDDQKMINTVVASRPGGATQRVVDQTARDTYGPYEPSEVAILKTTDNSVLDAANWTVSRYADPPPELREIPVEAYSMGATTYRALLGLDISGVLTVTGLPDEAPSSTQTVYIEGYTETIKQASHLISFHTSRSYNDSVWVLDDPTYSALGSTTRLAY